jgi:membrane protease YdiL (CAAX protease family)
MSQRVYRPEATSEPSAEASTHVTGRQILAALGLWVFTSAVLGTATIFGLRAVAPNWDPGVGPVVVVVAEVYLLLAVSLVICCGGLAGLRQRLAFRFTSWRDIVLAVNLAGAWVVLSAVCYTALAVAFGWSAKQTLLLILSRGTDMDRLADASAISLAFILLRVGFLVGLGEELLYRGALFSWLSSKYTARTTILVTTVLFTLQHALPILFPAAIILGLLAGWLRHRSGSTLNTLVMHAIVDLTMLLVGWLLTLS